MVILKIGKDKANIIQYVHRLNNSMFKKLKRYFKGKCTKCGGEMKQFGPLWNQVYACPKCDVEKIKDLCDTPEDEWHRS
jgi:tRNA G26 N,N-dimethylase Trm1